MEAAKHAPSTPGASDEWAPNNANLWKQVLEVASGERNELAIGDRTIHAPNKGRGYRNMPHNPMGIAWAVKQYNGFNGGWQRQAMLRLHQGAVTVTEAQGVDHDGMRDLQQRGLVRLAGVTGHRHYWEITRSGARLVRAGLFNDSSV